MITDCKPMCSCIGDIFLICRNLSSEYEYLIFPMHSNPFVEHTGVHEMACGK